MVFFPLPPLLSSLLNIEYILFYNGKRVEIDKINREYIQPFVLKEKCEVQKKIVYSTMLPSHFLYMHRTSTTGCPGNWLRVEETPFSLNSLLYFLSIYAMYALPIQKIVLNE